MNGRSIARNIDRDIQGNYDIRSKSHEYE